MLTAIHFDDDDANVRHTIDPMHTTAFRLIGTNTIWWHLAGPHTVAVDEEDPSNAIAIFTAGLNHALTMKRLRPEAPLTLEQLGWVSLAYASEKGGTTTLVFSASDVVAMCQSEDLVEVCLVSGHRLSVPVTMPVLRAAVKNAMEIHAGAMQAVLMRTARLNALQDPAMPPLPRLRG